MIRIARFFFSFIILTSISVFADDVKPNGCKGPTLCSSYPLMDDCGWHVDIGWLFEEMNVANSDVLLIHSDGAGTPSDPTRANLIVNYNFDLSSGVRASLGKYLDHDDWSVRTIFEWLGATSRINLDVSLEDNSVVPISMPTWPGTDNPAEDFRFYQTVDSFSVDYFLLDVFLSKGSYFSGKFAFDPFAGLKVAWLGFDERQTYFDPGTILPPFNTAPNSKLLRVTTTDFWGIGPMIGFDGTYYVCAGWSFFGVTNLSILMGESKINDLLGVVTGDADLPSSLFTKDTIRTFCSTLRNIIGIKYDQDVQCNTQHMTLRIGFDTRVYFNAYPYVEMEAQQRSHTSDFALSSYPNITDGNAWSMGGLLIDLSLDF